MSNTINLCEGYRCGGGECLPAFMCTCVRVCLGVCVWVRAHTHGCKNMWCMVCIPELTCSCIQFCQFVIQTFNAQDPNVTLIDTSRLKIGKNIMINRLRIINGKIRYTWLNLSFDTYTFKCKNLFLWSRSFKLSLDHLFYYFN